MPSNVRKATHAGSWYTSNGTELKTELDGYLSKVQPVPQLDYSPPISNAKAIIAPHAGYSYSGPTAAWAYAAIPSTKIKRVILLGPSHHVTVRGVALSKFRKYGTPLGDIPLDLDAIQELRKTGAFLDMKSDVDEDEHSLEMHLPYIRHIFQGRDDFSLVPLLVGYPGVSNSKEVCKALKKYWEDEETFFIVSSDFCHWGSRFSCTPYYTNAPHPPIPVPPLPHLEQSASYEAPNLVKRYTTSTPSVPIWQSIQYMDHEGMDLLRRPASFGALEKWEAYLAETKNTICGRNPISLLVQLVQYIYAEKAEKGEEELPEFTFVRYEQSSKCLTGRDSSVSYVSGVLRVPRGI